MSKLLQKIRKKKLYPLLWHLPAFLILIAIIGYPLVKSFIMGFNKIHLISEPRFVGIDNYINILADNQFWQALKNTLKFMIIAVSLQLIIGIIGALLLHNIKRSRGRRLTRTLAISPMMMTPVIVALMWKFLMDTDFGILNFFLESMGFNFVKWLASPSVALYSIIAVDVWQWTSLGILIFLASLQAIPEDYYEAAAIDGASKWQSFWHITLPMLRSGIIMFLIIRLLFSLRLFDTVYVLTSGGPANSTLTLSILIYRMAFRYFKQGEAAALSWIMLVIAVVLSFMVIFIFSKKEGQNE